MKPILKYLFAAVWIANGLYCKVLGLVPRHEQIVSRILGAEHAHLLTIAIGTGEILMAVWIITGLYPALNAIAQMLIIASMNIIEFVLAPDLLLWGRGNSIFAFLFIVLIYYHGFILNKKINQQ